MFGPRTLRACSRSAGLHADIKLSEQKITTDRFRTGQKHALLSRQFLTVLKLQQHCVPCICFHGKSTVQSHWRLDLEPPEPFTITGCAFVRIVTRSVSSRTSSFYSMLACLDNNSRIDVPDSSTPCPEMLVSRVGLLQA